MSKYQVTATLVVQALAIAAAALLATGSAQASATSTKKEVVQLPTVVVTGKAVKTVQLPTVVVSGVTIEGQLRRQAMALATQAAPKTTARRG